jgi:hypothetical protein
MKPLIFFFILCPFALFAQEPVVEWAKTFGGSSAEYPYSIIVTSDNKYLIAGNTLSSDGDISNARGGSDAWLLKLDENGLIIWKRNYGGTKHEGISSIIQTLDKGFLLIGTTNSTDGDVAGNNGDFDAWILKIDSIGNIQWQKTLGGSNIENAKSVFQTQNGDYILGINSTSSDKDFPINRGAYDMWIVKLSIQGNVLWKRNISGTKDDFVSELIDIDNKTFAIAAKTNSLDGDMVGALGDFSIKMDSSGNIIWKKSLSYINSSLAGLQELNAITMNKNGIVSVGTKVIDLVIPNPSPYTWDFMIIKSDTAGISKWFKLFGGSRTDVATSVKSFSNGDLLVTGYTQSNDLDVYNSNGDLDFWVLRLDSLGNLKNANCYGGSKEDQGYYSMIDKKGNVLVIGFSYSSNGTFLQNKGLADWAILKLKYGPTNTENSANERIIITEYPNPVTDKLVVKVSSRITPKFSMYDIAGRLIYHSNNLENITTIDMTVYPNGFYFLTYQLEGKYISRKIFKM